MLTRVVSRKVTNCLLFSLSLSPPFLTFSSFFPPLFPFPLPSFPIGVGTRGATPPIFYPRTLLIFIHAAQITAITVNITFGPPKMKLLPTLMFLPFSFLFFPLLPLSTDLAATTHKDDEYVWAGVEDPKIVVTTSHNPSSRLKQFAKVLIERSHFCVKI